MCKFQYGMLILDPSLTWYLTRATLASPMPTLSQKHAQRFNGSLFLPQTPERLGGLSTQASICSLRPGFPPVSPRVSCNPNIHGLRQSFRRLRSCTCQCPPVQGSRHPPLTAVVEVRSQQGWSRLRALFSCQSQMTVQNHPQQIGARTGD